MLAKLKSTVTKTDLDTIGIINSHNTLLSGDWFEVKEIKKELVYLEDSRLPDLIWIKHDFLEFTMGNSFELGISVSGGSVTQSDYISFL